MDNNKIHEKTDKQIVKTCATVIRKKTERKPYMYKEKKFLGLGLQLYNIEKENKENENKKKSIEIEIKKYNT